MKKSIEWWISLALALYLGICAIGAWGGTVGAIVTYVLFVLIDIREYAKVGAVKVTANRESASADTPEVGIRGE